MVIVLFLVGFLIGYYFHKCNETDKLNCVICLLLSIPIFIGYYVGKFVKKLICKYK